MEDAKRRVLAALLKVQQELKAPKNQKNTFSNFMFRSCEDILQAARPLCNVNGLLLVLQDEILREGERYYIHATAKVIDVETGEEFGTSAYAREPEQKTKFDEAQVTGASSSYARKYALCALFAIDDTKDADTDEYQKQKGSGQNRQQAQQSQQAQDEKGTILQALLKDMKKNDMGTDEIKLLIQWKFKKNSSKELTLQECRLLATHYMQYWNDFMQQEGAA